jgi:hypothetical protein
MEKGWKITLIVLLCFGLLTGSVFAVRGIGTKKVAEGNNMVMISHTEYGSGQAGQIIVRVLKFNGLAVTGATCDAEIWNPDKTSFASGSMTATSVDGDYYYNFTAPATEGVYEYQANCQFSIGAKNFNSTATNSFHLNPALTTIEALYNLTQEINTVTNSTYALTVVINGTVTNIYTDTQWLVDNIVTEDWFNTSMTSIGDRFDTVDETLVNVSGEIQDLKDYCSNPDTSGSTLCTQVDDMWNFIQVQNNTFNEFRDTLLEINGTTNNIWTQLTTNVSIELDYTQLKLEELLGLTTEVNATVNTILSNQEETINMYVFSG